MVYRVSSRAARAKQRNPILKEREGTREGGREGGRKETREGEEGGRKGGREGRGWEGRREE